MVFETIRFGRSRIPPQPGQCRRAGGEELLEQARPLRRRGHRRARRCRGADGGRRRSGTGCRARRLWGRRRRTPRAECGPRRAAPAHMGHGSSVTTSTQSSSRQPSRSRAASRDREEFRVRGGITRELALVVPSREDDPIGGRTITAPTGTSSCASAARASSRAVPMRSSNWSITPSAMVDSAAPSRSPSTAPLRLLDEAAGRRLG